MKWEERRHRIVTPDGWEHDVLEIECESPDGPAATVVAGHAMMVDRRTLYRRDRLSIVGALAERGLRVLVPDLRGHGESGPTPEHGGDWTYQDLVRDTEAYIDLACRLAPDEPIVLLGHSLFGHTSLAYLASKEDPRVEAVVALASTVWLRRFEPYRTRWVLKRATIGILSGTVRLWGYIPARKLGIGSADESAGYWRDTARFVGRDTWSSPDGVDYLGGLSSVRCPVLHVLSDGDWLYAHPRDSAPFLEGLGRWRELWRLTREEWEEPLGGRLPDHMGLVTSVDSRPLWERMADWILVQAEEAG